MYDWGFKLFEIQRQGRAGNFIYLIWQNKVWLVCDIVKNTKIRYG